MRLEELYPKLSTYLPAVQERLAAIAASDLLPLVRAGEQALGGAAKRYRPAVVLLCAEACGAAGERVVEYAALVEAVHSASLVHDDVVDEADRRRGVPSLRARLGNKMAVLVGDYLVARSLRSAAEDGDLVLMRLLAATAEQMARAQVQELLGGVLLDEPTYLEIISGKTASLFSCAARVGTLLAAAGPAQQAALARYGWHVGMAFQLADDLKDLSLVPQDPGKPAHRDLATGKVTLPVIWTLREGEEALRHELRELLTGGAGNGETARIVALVAGGGGVQYTVQAAREHIQQAQGCLGDLPAGPACAALAALAESLVPAPVPA